MSNEPGGVKARMMKTALDRGADTYRGLHPGGVGDQHCLAVNAAGFTALANRLNPLNVPFKFTDFGFSLDGPHLTVQGEISKASAGGFLASTDAQYILAGYRMRKFTPYAMYARQKVTSKRTDTTIPRVGPLIPLALGVDQLINDQIKEKRQIAVGEVGVGFDPLSEPVEWRRGLDVDTDQVLRREKEVLLADLDPLAIELGGEKDDENVARVLVELRPLVLVADVLERERVKLEGLLEQLVVGLVRILDVEPESLLALGEASRDGLGLRLDQWALRRDQVPGHYLTFPAASEGRGSIPFPAT